LPLDKTAGVGYNRVMNKKVRVGKKYVFHPVGFDLFDPTKVAPKAGDVVKVVNKFGCPPCGTMGFCYVDDAVTGEFRGLVLCNSLEEVQK
jgi:hypothetical protein